MGLSASLFPWRIWLAVSAIAIIFFYPTLTTAVPVWIDESLIVEYGHVTLAGQPPGFTFHQRSDAGRPMYLYTLLGGIFPELAFRLTAPSNAGPRLAALIGQLAAAGWFLYYLCLRGADVRWSLLLGLAFFLDPLCDISWRGGRVDAWAFAFLFASMSAIQVGSKRYRDGLNGGPAACLGGVAAAAGLFCWPSFVMLLPLIAIELANFVSQRKLFALLLFAAGGAVTAILIVLPFRQEFWYGVADDALLALRQSRTSLDAPFGNRLNALLLAFAPTPVLFVAGTSAVVWRRNAALAASFLVALALTFGTTIYRLRVLYLLPYLYVALASVFWREARPIRSAVRKIAAVAVGLMLLEGTGFTVAGTTLSGVTSAAGKNPLALIEPMRQAVGAGPVRVFAQPQDLYFVGRTLGWRQFNCFDGCWGPGMSSPPFQEILARTEFAIFRDRPDPGAKAIIESLGYRFYSVVLPGGGYQNTLLGWKYGPRIYGPYFIYRRPAAANSPVGKRPG